VYDRFPTKEALFRAVIRRATETSERFVAERVEAAVGEGEVSAEITAFALTHARTVLTPRVVATRRMLIGEAHRFPDLAAEYFERAPSAVIQAIAARLERYDDLGLLVVPDARAAAEHFAYLVLGATLDRALFTPGGVDPQLVDATAAAGAAVFLRAYRAPASEPR
jgi:TetR/AcrR family transcriptional repressor of mexJK operon